MRYDGNLAYDVEFRENTARVQEKVQEHKQKSKAKARTEAARMHKTIGVCAIALALCAGFMISRNVAVYESKNQVRTLQKEYNQLKEYSSQKAFELDQSIDLEMVEEVATTQLDMARPEKYQTVYVNIKQDDVTEITARQVEGSKGIFGIFKR